MSTHETSKPWHRHFDPETIKQITGLNLRAPRRAEGRLIGHRRNARLGGMADFAQHRQYVPGDDLRLVDWKVFGRTDRYFLKQREEETNLICHLVLDASGSMSFRGTGADIDKLEYARRWAGAIAYLAHQRGDQVSLSSFATQLQTHLSATRMGTSSMREFAMALDRIQPLGETSVGNALDALAHRLPNRGTVMVISDFLDHIEPMRLGIQRIAAREHQVVFVQIVDPAERQLPWTFPVRLIGLEGEMPLDLEPSALRKAYLASRDAFFAELQHVARRMSATWITVSTDEFIGLRIRRWLTLE